MSNLLLKFFLSLNIVKNIIFNRYSKYPKYVIDFEKNLAEQFSSQYTLSFANGTQAFEASLLSLGLKKGSKIALSKLSFTSTCITILKNGYQPIYMDFDNDLKMILNKKILDENISGVIVTYAYGYTNEIKNVEKIKYLYPNIKIIADCSHAHGANFNEKNIVNYSDISFMSLQGAKAISAGEGGIIFTNSKIFLNRMIELSHPSREFIDKKNLNFNVPGFSKYSKSRLHPLGAILANYDLITLKKRNKEIRDKITIIYKILKNNKNLYLPNIEIKNTGGFHYGIPFICETNFIYKNYKKIPIKKYNYLKYECYHEFTSIEYFNDSILKEDKLSIKKETNSYQNDIRDNLYFIDLDWIKKTRINKLKKEIYSFLKFLENNDY